MSSFLSTMKKHGLVCKVFGVVTHFLMIVSQMWATIICFDLAVTMYSSVAIATRNKAKTFKKYLAIAFTVPVPFVTTPVILNETGQVNVGYEEICWIQHFETRLWSYIAPIAVLYMFAFSALAISFWKIRATKKQTKKALESNRGHVGIVKIALKLVIGLGLIDIIGFVQLPGVELKEHNKVLSMIYTILRSLKGLFVCLLYLVNRKVLNLYKGWMPRNVLNNISMSSLSRTVTLATK